jgi:hypothetical protein
MSLTKVTQAMIDAPFGNVKDYGAKGDNSTDDSAAIQAAVNDICGADGILYFPPGGYLLKTTITFPNKSFSIFGSGPTATFLAADPTTPNITLFDFSGCTGPAKVIRDISFNGPAPSVYGGTAVKAYGNGYLFDNVWFRGIAVGLDAQGSFINTDNCVAEYCFEAAKSSNTLDESMWRGWTMYKNETDYVLGGDNKTFTIRDTNCIATKTLVFDVSCNGVLIDGVTVQNDGTGYTPDIFEINGSQNVINNVLINSFGNRGFFFQGATTVRNRISNVMIYNIANGILFSESSRNSVSNISIRDCQSGYGIYFDTCTDNTIENFLLQGNDYNVQISASNDNALYNGQMLNAQTADFYLPVVNADRIFISNVRADFAGIGSLPYKMQTLSGGQKQVLAAAAPTTGTWAVGDICINSAPAIGSPKGWRCTVAGTPGTWTSEGNL